MAKTEKALQAGDLDRIGTALSLGTHKNSKGGVDGNSYGLFLGNIPCKKEELSGTETSESNRETAFGKVEFTVRYYIGSQLKPTMRWQCEGVEYDIENVREGPGRKQWTILSCKRRN